MNPDCPLAPNPFALSLSKGCSWFDKLTTNGLLRSISPNGQSGMKMAETRMDRRSTGYTREEGRLCWLRGLLPCRMPIGAVLGAMR